MYITLLGIIATILLIIACVCMCVCDDYRVSIICGVLGTILLVYVLYNDFTSETSSSRSSDKDLYNYSTWDYDGDGTLDGKEMKDYQNFKSEMNKERNRRYN